MAFGSRRQFHYNTLRKAGFLRFEAQALSKVPFDVPYMPALIKQRMALLARAKKEGKSVPEYKAGIFERYRTSGWFDPEGELSPWEMLRQFEDRYRAQHPAYESPWQKPRRRIPDSKAFKLGQRPQKVPRKRGKEGKPFG